MSVRPDDPGERPNTIVQRRGAIGVVVRDGRLLVIRRSQWVVAPGKLCFPGGGIEENETEEAAVVRELREELQIDVLPVRRVWRNVTSQGVELLWWLASLDDAVDPVPVPAEVESIHWYAAAEMAHLADLLESNRQFLAALASGEITLD